LGPTINALLVVGDSITVTVPSGGTTVASGQVVGFGGASGNVISGGTLAYAAAEPLFFVQGTNNQQQVDVSSASGQFTLTLMLNPPSAPAPTTGATQVVPVVPQTTAVLDAATLTATALQQAIESLPAVGPGNVVVNTVAAGVFTVTFAGLLAGTALPQLLVNAFGAVAPTVSTNNLGGGSLKISSSVTGTAGARKERKGRL